ncbi:hypothetical protein [Streptomyces sp. B6B3]|uniref:hypothetical protein n=1 Tax=Streptomyces sp. B6B3 TaxID=3153570 RepID=UPI00325E0BE4
MRRAAVATYRLTRHELVLTTSLLRWVTRRPPHGVRPAAGDLPVPYASGQTTVFLLFFFVSVVETVALAFLIPWPLVHRLLLVLGVWGCYFVVALHASCVVRPHVVGADGSLRLRYGALVGVAVPADRIASVRRDRRFPGGGLVRVGDDGELDLAVGSQTNVTVELTEPVAFTRPLGRRASARVLRFYADDPDATVAALRTAGTRT